MLAARRGARGTAAPGGAQQRAAPPQRHRAVAARASRDGEGKGRRVDWDGEWRSFMSDRQQAGAPGGDARPSNVYTTTSGGPGARRRAAVPVDPAAKLTRDAIKREEAFLLDAWSSDKFQSLGLGVAVLVLLAVLLAAGPPPVDSRCTLPWC